ncbi:atp-dependent rna helicase [Stylonychia lemnae]|uniref:Atp-dependent rna helicase n=1 Tax=Stylonychia lemnae TaxID=5949 RepID=A0A077ZZK7_STYLE|nr:atp-dependent rna helicase [Stylonychia lemnae]|eukprot:CDW73958.1 atp-dependent rna helicase [Stylonychia lemnae]
MEKTQKSTQQKIKVEHPYGFPFKPYQVQLDLMDKIFETLSKNQKIGLFESPTGTGKSLSLVCSILTWYTGKQKTEEQKSQTNSDWLSMFDTTDTNQAMNHNKQIFKKRVYSSLNSNDIREIQSNLKQSKSKCTNIQYLLERQQMNLQTNRDEHIISYDSDQEDKKVKLKNITQKAKSLSSGVGSGNFSILKQSAKDRQIIFCTRTHSQISQIINEIKRTEFADQISVVPIISRRGLCVHEKLKDITNSALLNEKCQDLTEKSNCEYNDQKLTDIISDSIVDKVHDIEEIGNLASSLKICGYFGSRKAMAEADVIIRYWFSMKLITQWRLFAHQIQSKYLIVHQKLLAIKSKNIQVIYSNYDNLLAKYGSRLSPKNHKYLKDIVKVVVILNNFLQKKLNNPNEIEQDKQEVMNVMDLLIETDLYQVDFVKLYEFFEKSDLVRKLNGFIQSSIKLDQEKGQSKQNIQTFNKSVLYEIRDFIRILSHNPNDGKMILNLSFKQNQQSSIQYLCLNPTTTLKRILDQIKAMIFISGTLEPSQEFNLLLKYVDQDQISRFNCDHIIPKQHFQGLIIPNYKNIAFDFRHSQRSNQQQMTNLCEIILLSSQNTPKQAGVIVFLQSYGYKQQFLNYLKQKDDIMTQLQEERKIFEESQDQKIDVFQEYSREITKNKRGAILFCVIGGKLSEGINFSDDLARTVIVVGLPYANSQSIDIKEKMRYFDLQGDQSFKGNDYYENLCMKTLNQSIGRAIRHINDYACIILVDQRFQNRNIMNKLPRWIQSRIKEIKQSEQDLLQDLQQFFKYFEE